MKDKSEYQLMPKSLSSDRGDKYLLIGEFFEQIEVDCIDCEGSGAIPKFKSRSSVGYDDCEICQGSGSITQKVPIQWTTIKEIYKKISDKYSKENVDYE